VWLEVDLVARRGDRIACVEVKCGWVPRLEGATERDMRWRPAARVDRERAARLAAAAGALAGRARHARGAALVAEVRLDPEGGPIEVRIAPVECERSARSRQRLHSWPRHPADP
jgi:hypothetical protein